VVARWHSKLLLTLTVVLCLALGFAAFRSRSLLLAFAALALLVCILLVREVGIAAAKEAQTRAEIVSGLLAAERLRMEAERTREREHAEARFRGLLESSLSAQRRAEESLHALSARLLQLQDEERRRLARELHDSGGQLLAAISMNLIPLQSESGLSAGAAHAIRESIELAGQLSEELRTISHLLHPPLLDQAGLRSGLGVYLQGFSERSRIKVDFDCPKDFGRLPEDLETALFRIVQECLTNIHRHSGSSVAEVRLNRSGRMVLLEVADRGRGISPEKRKALDSEAGLGVGIRGMRERIRQLGGDLQVQSNGKGTLVIAQVMINTSPVTAVA